MVMVHKKNGCEIEYTATLSNHDAGLVKMMAKQLDKLTFVKIMYTSFHMKMSDAASLWVRLKDFDEDDS